SLQRGALAALVVCAFGLAAVAVRGPAGGLVAGPDGQSVAGTPASAMVGISGSTVERLAAEVPSARTCPAFTFGAMVVMASNIICTCPPMTLLRISPDALCGTCTRSVPLMALNSSAAM